MPRPTESPAPPRVSQPDLPRDLDATRGLAPRSDLFQATVEQLSDETDASHSILTECRLGAASVASLDLTGATLVDVDIDDLRATTVTARRARMRRVRAVGGRIGTLDLADAEVDELELRGIRIDYVSLAGARLEDVVIVDCTITTLDLPHATIARLRFADTTVDEVDTRGMRSEDLDLRGLEALAYTDAAALRGATFSPRQIEQLAPVLAGALGIRVRD